MKTESERLAADPASGKLLQVLEAMDAEIVHVGVFDYSTMFRERRLRRADLVAGAATANFANVLPKWDGAESIVFPGPFESERVEYDIESIRRYPFEPHAAVVVADYIGPQRSIMPRRLLADQIARAGRLGFEVDAAFEVEFVVLDETAESLRTKRFGQLSQFVPDNRCWSGQTAATHAEFVAALEQRLLAADIGVHSLGVELGPGCFEATLRHTHAMKAADDMAFFRMFTKAHCRNLGKTASFMPSLGEGFPAIGGHATLSLRRVGSRENLFADPADAHGLSSNAYAFLAGVIDMVPEAFAMVAHTVNAYRRLAPGTWAPKTVSWAPYNYAAALRTASETPDSTRIECRLPGSDLNPYLALALLLGAGLDGIERKSTLDVPPISSGGPSEIPAGVPRLPVDLLDATRRLRCSERAKALFGAPFIEHFSALCEAEDTALRKAVSPTEVQRYLEAG